MCVDIVFKDCIKSQKKLLQLKKCPTSDVAGLICKNTVIAIDLLQKY